MGNLNRWMAQLYVTRVVKRIGRYSWNEFAIRDLDVVLNSGFPGDIDSQRRIASVRMSSDQYSD